jgi:hypothetical protein
MSLKTNTYQHFYKTNIDPIFSYLNLGYTVLYVYKIYFNTILPSAVYPRNHLKHSKLL